MNNHPRSLVNGTPADKISLTDRGIQYGDGVFRTMLVADGQVVDMAAQLDKLYADANRLGIKGISPETLRDDIHKLLDQCQGFSALKIILTRGNSNRGYVYDPKADATRIVSIFELSDVPNSYWTKGVDLFVCTTRLGKNAALSGIKHLNRLEQVLARNEFGNEFQEGLMLDTDNQVISGTMSNIYFVSNGSITTPSLELSGVRGFMLDKIQTCAGESGLSLNTGHIHLQQIDAAEEVFVSNSLIGIWPVRSIGQKQWRRGPLTSKLQHLIQHPRIPENT